MAPEQVVERAPVSPARTLEQGRVAALHLLSSKVGLGPHGLDLLP
jgi:hypothetical protein